MRIARMRMVAVSVVDNMEENGEGENGVVICVTCGGNLAKLIRCESLNRTMYQMLPFGGVSRDWSGLSYTFP